VRKYMSEFWETVCYAVPKSRMAEDVPNSLAP